MKLRNEGLPYREKKVCAGCKKEISGFAHDINGKFYHDRECFMLHLTEQRPKRVW